MFNQEHYYKESHELSRIVADDVFRTLFGLTAEELSKTDRFFGPPIQIHMAFVSEDGETMWPLTLQVPLGQIIAREADYEALKVRIAEQMSKKLEQPIRVATEEEIEGWAKKADLARQMKMLAMMPRGSMGEA